MILMAGEEGAGEIRSLLEQSGVRVVEWARSGAGWIAPWQKAKPSIVVVDLQLPKRDGLYCLGKIRELDAQSKVLFTHAYSGSMANEVEIRALALGAGAAVQFPCPAVRFTQALRGLLQKR